MKKKPTNIEFCISQSQPSKVNGNKDILSQTKTEGICYKYLCLARNVKLFRGKGNKIDQKLVLHKERKSIREGINEGKINSFICLTLNWSKGQQVGR